MHILAYFSLARLGRSGVGRRLRQPARASTPAPAGEVILRRTHS